MLCGDMCVNKMWDHVSSDTYCSHELPGGMESERRPWSTVADGQAVARRKYRVDEIAGLHLRRPEETVLLPTQSRSPARTCCKHNATYSLHRLTTLIIRRHLLTLSFQASNLPFLQILPHHSLPFLLQDWLHGFPVPPDCLPILLTIYVFIPAKARDYVFTGVGLSVCLSVGLFVCYHDN